MGVARADGGRTETVVLAFPAVLEGVPVLLHLLRESTEPNHDGLTGGLPRDALARAVADELHRAARSGLPVSLALVDVDQLKRINDRRGHEAGDRALVEVAGALRTGRRQDVLGRWGGDEFVLLLPETGVEGARRPLEHALTALWADTEGGRSRVSFSAGVVEMSSAEPLEAALRRADTLLYRAKRR